MNIEMQLGSSESIKRYLLRFGSLRLYLHSGHSGRLAHNKLRIVDTDGLEINRSFSFVTAHGQLWQAPETVQTVLHKPSYTKL